MTKNLIIVGICILFIGVILALLFRPAPKPEIIGDLTPAQENELRANLVTLEGQNDSLRRELGKREAKDSVQQEGFKRAITTLQKENKRLSENPKVVEIRTSVPEVDSLLSLKDVIITRQADRIAEMDNSAQVTKQINGQIAHNFDKRLADTQALLKDKEMEVTQLQGENKKLRRKLTLTKIGGVILLGGIGALLVVN